MIGEDLAGHAESVILEAVGNAVRHSGATRLTVEVAVADELDIMVTDDGCGIGVDNGRRSGLANIASRADPVGGHCHLAAPQGGGNRCTGPFRYRSCDADPTARSVTAWAVLRTDRGRPTWPVHGSEQFCASLYGHQGP